MQTFKTLILMASVAALFVALFIFASYESYRRDVRVCMADSEQTESSCEAKFK